MSNTVIIGNKEIAALRKAMDRARQNPTPLEIVTQGFSSQARPGEITLADREAMERRGVQRPKSLSNHVLIPRGYRVAISFEEQPAGLCMHLSMSSERKRKVPAPEAVEMVLNVLGFPLRLEDCELVWLEEFEPEQKAVNVVLMVTPRNVQ